ANIIFGVAQDPDMDNEVRITLVAIPVSIPPVLPIYDHARGHGGMPRSERSY
ncbi:unnamed protein product, partial [marine sediment metagenome]